MEGFLILLAFPIVWPIIAKILWGDDITLIELSLNILIVVIAVSGVWYGSIWSATSDTEIWNGQLLQKTRTHGMYDEYYECNCVTDSKGNRSCSVCYRTHYTVDWDAKTSVGPIKFGSLDSTSRNVYSRPDPKDYTAAYVGEPVSLPHRYTNWVQAAPTTLFRDDSSVASQFAGKIPEQPRVYGRYHYDHVINDGVLTPEDETALNTTLREALKTLGPSHQVNIIVILTTIADPQYRYAVENYWQGGEKNDVVVFIGANKDKTIAWADVMTWALNSGNENLQVVLRDKLLAMGQIDQDKISALVISEVKSKYVRPKMKDYEYIKDSIDPPTWAIVLSIIFAIGGSLVLSYIFKLYDISTSGIVRRR